jgi:hypothetical protein
MGTAQTSSSVARLQADTLRAPFSAAEQLFLNIPITIVEKLPTWRITARLSFIPINAKVGRDSGRDAEEPRPLN